VIHLLDDAAAVLGLVIIVAFLFWVAQDQHGERDE
jgi:hypothetical protein